jgi:PleD family two-component response regulator
MMRQNHIISRTQTILKALMKKADTAMYMSKTQGRNQFHLFQTGMVMSEMIH